MANAIYSNNKPKIKVGIQHVLLMVVMVTAFAWFFFYQVLPSGTANFVVSLFAPSGEARQKIGFVHFDGLVFASTSLDKEAKLVAQGTNIPIAKKWINKDFIFDFSFATRTEDEHGYVKGSNEFYAKCASLGEHAIILEPYIGFSILALVLAVLSASLITMFLPSKLGFLAALFDRQIDNTQIKIRLQTGFTDGIVHILTLPDDKLEDMDRREVENAYRTVWNRTVSDSELSSKQSISFDELYDEETDLVMFRNEAIYTRIKEFFSDFVVKEVEDTKNGLGWRRNHAKIPDGLRLYMSHHFTEKYSNRVTGLAYGGAAVLIVAVGIRGLKFIPAQKPSFIMFSIFLEFTMLSLLAFTLFYTEEHERMDKMLKKMEDASRDQLETLKTQSEDIHMLSAALVGQTSQLIKQRVESAISDYMTSGDHVQKVIAEEIAKKIMFNFKEDAK